MLKCIGMRDRTVKNGHKTIKTRFGRKVADVGFVIYSVCIRTEKVAYFCCDFKGTINTNIQKQKNDRMNNIVLTRLFG